MHEQFSVGKGFEIGYSNHLVQRLYTMPFQIKEYVEKNLAGSETLAYVKIALAICEGLFQDLITCYRCLWSPLVAYFDSLPTRKLFDLQHRENKTNMAADLVPVWQSPYFTWAFHSINGFVARFSPTKLLSIWSGDYLDHSLAIKERDYYTGVNDIPDEILVYIFQFLDHKELGKCEIVSKRWKVLIDNYPELWRNVRLENDALKLTYRRLSVESQLRSYVNHLVGQGARIKNLVLNFDKYDESTYNIVAFLVSSGCCANLNSTAIKWSEDCSYGESAEFETGFVFYLSTLKLMETFSSNVMTINTQFNWTFESVNYISKFKDLRVLNIKCVPRVHTIQKWHIEKLLKTLTKLEEFHLCVTIMPKLVQKYVFESQSLKILDISNCVNILITKMDLPQLESLNARGMICHRNVCTLHKAFCFYEVLQAGCPLVTKINNASVDASEAIFGLPYKEQCSMKICFCERHRRPLP